MILLCLDPQGLEEFLQYGWHYKATRLPCGAVRVQVEEGESIVCAASRFSELVIQ